MNLEQQTVVVTGGARGIGRAIAKMFVAHGANVVLVDLLAEQLQQTASELNTNDGTVLPIATDITEPTQVEAMAQQVQEQFGPVDILVNCAGTFSVIGPVWEVDPERWLRDVRVNLCGTFLVCRYLVGAMVAQGQGYVINIVSTGGVSDPHAHCTSYASSKTGLMRFTEGLAAEGKEHGIKVFAVAPPAILTDMTRFIMEDPGGQQWRPGFDRFFAEGRDAPPEAVADMIRALVSGKADALTGRYFDVREDLEAILAQSDSILEEDRLTLRIRQ